jgi:CYTH domain-containing protein
MRPGQGRYARLEREQRWLLNRLPVGVSAPVLITDRYVTGTRLRLRRIREATADTYKLGQKIRVDEDDPERVEITNMYLTGAEYLRLLVLPGAEIVKSRRWLEWADHRIAVDEFAGRHRGLLLAEVELADAEVPLPLPPFARRDVTHDGRYSGGALASAHDGAIASLTR